MWSVVSTLNSYVCSTRIFYKSICCTHLIDVLLRDKTSICKTPPNVSYLRRVYLSQSANNDKKDSKPSDTNKTKKPKEIKNYVTLLGPDKSMYVTTVEDAAKLADRRNFKLVKVKDFDTKAGRPVYQLMTETEFLKFNDEDPKTKKDRDISIKGEKSVSINSAISENDVKTKVNMMRKWVSKMLQVKVVIIGDSTLGEKVVSIIEREIGTDGKVVKNKSKGGLIRLVINPPKKANEVNT